MIHDHDQSGLDDDPSYHNIDRPQITTQNKSYKIYTTLVLLTNIFNIFSRLLHLILYVYEFYPSYIVLTTLK